MLSQKHQKITHVLQEGKSCWRNQALKTKCYQQRPSIKGSSVRACLPASLIFLLLIHFGAFERLDTSIQYLELLAAAS